MKSVVSVRLSKHDPLCLEKSCIESSTVMSIASNGSGEGRSLVREQDTGMDVERDGGMEYRQVIHWCVSQVNTYAGHHHHQLSRISFDFNQRTSKNKNKIRESSARLPKREKKWYYHLQERYKANNKKLVAARLVLSVGAESLVLTSSGNSTIIRSSRFHQDVIVRFTPPLLFGRRIHLVAIVLAHHGW